MTQGKSPWAGTVRQAWRFWWDFSGITLASRNHFWSQVPYPAKQEGLDLMISVTLSVLAFYVVMEFESEESICQFSFPVWSTLPGMFNLQGQYCAGGSCKLLKEWCTLIFTGIVLSHLHYQSSYLSGLSPGRFRMRRSRSHVDGSDNSPCPFLESSQVEKRYYSFGKKKKNNHTQADCFLVPRWK